MFKEKVWPHKSKKNFQQQLSQHMCLAEHEDRLSSRQSNNRQLHLLWRRICDDESRIKKKISQHIASKRHRITEFNSAY